MGQHIADLAAFCVQYAWVLPEQRGINRVDDKGKFMALFSNNHYPHFKKAVPIRRKSCRASRIPLLKEMNVLSGILAFAGLFFCVATAGATSLNGVKIIDGYSSSMDVHSYTTYATCGDRELDTVGVNHTAVQHNNNRSEGRNGFTIQNGLYTDEYSWTYSGTIQSFVGSGYCHPSGCETTCNFTTDLESRNDYNNPTSYPLDSYIKNHIISLRSGSLSLPIINPTPDCFNDGKCGPRITPGGTQIGTSTSTGSNLLNIKLDCDEGEKPTVLNIWARPYIRTLKN